MSAPDLPHTVLAELDRLVPPGAPIAVAYSGGGDSSALLHILRERAGLALIVDHGLGETSAERTREAIARAQAVGVDTLPLLWTTPKRQQAAARTARYSLMGEVCRARGIRHLVVGHTADDQRETLVMRRRRDAKAGGMRPLSHAPVWPGLRGVTLVRPLLGVGRERLRGYNRAHGLEWDEDPANADKRYERVRVRAGSEQAEWTGTPRKLDPDAVRFGMGHAECAPDADPELVALALTCVSGSPTLLTPFPSPRGFAPKQPRSGCDAHGWPSAARSDEGNTASRLQCSREPSVSPSSALAGTFSLGEKGGKTFGGARIVSTSTALRLLRDPGAVLGRFGVPPLAPVALRPGETCLWDRRILVTARVSLTLRPLGTDWPDGVPRPHIDIRRTLPGAYRDGVLLAVPGHGEAAAWEDVAEARFRGMVGAMGVPHPP